MVDFSSLRREILGYRYIKRRCRQYDQALIRRVRSLDDASALALVLEVTLKKQAIGILLATHTLQGTEKAGIFLRQGFAHGNAHDIQYWMKAVKPVLGWRGTVDALYEQRAIDPRPVERALYHFRKVYHKAPDFREMIRELGVLSDLLRKDMVR